MASYLEFEIKNFRKPDETAYVGIDVVSRGIPRRGENYWESEAPELEIENVYLGDDDQTNYAKDLTPEEELQILERAEKELDSDS